MGGFFGFNNNNEVAKKAAAEKAAAEQKAKETQPQNAITGNAGMSAMQRREKEAGLADGGMVRGKGTGTSDSIPMELRKGSYVLPADSTRKMNDEKVPVRVSNGERVFSPEELQAIGAQVVEAMKVATHVPVDEKSAPPLMLADGGVVEEKRKTVFTDANTDPRTGEPKTNLTGYPQGFTPQSNPQVLQQPQAKQGISPLSPSVDPMGLNKSYTEVIDRTKEATRDKLFKPSMAVPNAQNAARGFAGAAGQVVGGLGSVGNLAVLPAAKVADAALNFGEAVTTGKEPANTNRLSGSLAPQTPMGFQPQKGTGYGFGDDVSQESSVVKPAQAPSQTTSKVAPQQGDKIYNKEAGIAEYVGAHGERAFSNIRPEDRNKGGNMTVVPANTYGMYDPTKPLPVAQPTQPAQGFAPGNQINHVQSVGFGFEPKDPAIVRTETIQRNAEMAAARAGISQPTPKMLEAETNKMQAYDAMATAGMNNATRQAELAANVGAKNAELAQRDSQFGATNRLAQNADNRAQGAYGFSLADSTRMQAAQDAVTSAKTPEERSLAAQNLRALQGKDQQERYGALQGGTTVDAAGNVIRNPNLVYDKINGEVRQTGDQEQGHSQPTYDAKTAEGMIKAIMKRNMPEAEKRQWIDTINANTQ